MSPRYGSRLMPVVVDEIARTHPNLPYASIPLTSNINDGFKNITFSEIATATNYLTGWIDRNLGCSTSFETLAYMGLGDLRYVVIFLAAVKCGYKVLLPSLRNSPSMNVSLLEQTACSHLLYASEVEAMVEPLLDEKTDLEIHRVHSFEELIRPEAENVPYKKEYETARWDPVLILHSSGSTGLPRPIQMNHNTFAVGDNDRNLPTVPGRVNQNWSLWDFPNKEPFFSPFPAFHLAGFSSMIMLPIYYAFQTTLILAPPTRPPTGYLLNEIMNHFQLKSIFCPPIIAEQLIQEPGGLEKCKHLKFLLYAGGPLSQAAGDALSKFTDVCQFYGQSETGAIQTLVPKRDDWASLEWHPMQEVIMEPSVDDSFEMVMKRNPALEGVRSLSCNFPDVDLWRTKDLFKPHPVKPNLWRFHGRVDDIIVLSNGEKFNPVPSETQIAAHPLLSGALILGQGHPQASLILEPKTHSQEAEDIIEAVWPTIAKSNAEAPGHARITRNMIMVSCPAKPFERAAKGTVIRSSTGKKYEKEIAGLYARVVSKNLQKIKLHPSPDLKDAKAFVTRVVASAFPGRDLDESDDFFSRGLDSLQTTEIVSLLNAGITSTNRDRDVSWISAKLVYQHPSIETLANAVLDHLDISCGASNINGSGVESRQRKMEDMVDQYIKGLPTPRGDIPPKSPGFSVLLTGSTGSLGTQILAKLLSETNVTKVYCLDRSPNSQDRVASSLAAWPSAPKLETSRVSFHQAHYDVPNFGLPSSAVNEIQNNINVIVHNAWKVDFNHPLDSFEAVHIQGVRDMINFSIASRYQPRILFVSSLSSVGNWKTFEVSALDSDNRTLIAEAMPSTPAAAQPMGYAESKAVAEQILAHAVAVSRISVAILRVGQIAGPIGSKSGGVWNQNEWFPLLLKTSKPLGKIPDAEALGNIDWVPIDVVASVIWDLVKAEESMGLQVFHLINPTLKPWGELLPVVQRRLSSPKAVSMDDWVAELEKVDLNDLDAVALKPAVKILDFFREMRGGQYIGAKDVMYSTTEMQKKSAVLKGLGPVQEEWIERWMGSWGL
ncbi:acetyl-CoA synthetase-like protein [Delitschia confertaspora ATCC 74209]|uniref:Acetyl-CoA synthetase-like protein n=1 Tax=Delitschia confertaspora ATCC 74209 TaxID=1513339 RepID=A0A9P4JVR9_9PLEO|nr:acetyl-CoA synthetase-like protein [Delitschia confertaspora ATCC 74209]